MRAVTRDIYGAPATGAAPEKITDAVEDFIEKIRQALLSDGIDGINLEARLGHLASMMQWTVEGFNDRVVRDFEHRIDQQLAVKSALERGSWRREEDTP